LLRRKQTKKRLPTSAEFQLSPHSESPFHLPPSENSLKVEQKRLENLRSSLEAVAKRLAEQRKQTLEEERCRLEKMRDALDKERQLFEAERQQSEETIGRTTRLSDATNQDEQICDEAINQSKRCNQSERCNQSSQTIKAIYDV